jgi:NhaA family Na+:H+ antiporter
MPIKTKLPTLFLEFFYSEKASGTILLLCTAVALLIANSPLGTGFLDFWHIEAGFEFGDFHVKYSLGHWINDGLMAIFFLLIGLEIERELYIGELTNLKNAMLPIFAAVGGMITPALLYLFITYGSPAQPGFGIPMATDIAFALGALSLLGSRIPLSLKIFLTALAIIDDLGAIVVIAIFYASNFSLLYLVLALSIFAVLVIFNRLGVNALAIYLILGAVMWYLMLQSGVHAAIAGVLLAFAIPFRDGSVASPSYRLQHFLHRPVAFIIMPLFALANTGVILSGMSLPGLLTRNTFGVLAGLLIGKPLGIITFSLLAVKMRLSTLPDGISYRHLIGAGFLGGIGFTMSIFITLLAFNDPVLVQSSKIAIILASLSAGIMGFLILSSDPTTLLLKKKKEAS